MASLFLHQIETSIHLRQCNHITPSANRRPLEALHPKLIGPRHVCTGSWPVQPRMRPTSESMNSKTIAKRFAQMGARFRIVRPEDRLRHRSRSDYALDIVSDKWGQLFEMQLSAEREAEFEIDVLQCNRHDPHLLLLVKTPMANDRFLCGHDEREWFVAAVPGGASSVAQAKLALLPPEVREAADHAHLNQRQRTRRHNRAFIRQGEWFFVPAPGLCVDRKRILRNEPIRRGGGKPHMVAEVFRTGGDRVRVCSRFPNGILESEYQALIARDPKAARWGWEVRFRDAGVYARGTVRHRDHATITLHDWHRVWMNTENTTRTMANVAFLD
jgi:hypothetical protein